MAAGGGDLAAGGRRPAVPAAVQGAVLPAHRTRSSQPTLEQRFESWANYCDIFDLLLGASRPSLELPNQWLWDIIDEFIYQFQAFCQFRSRVKGKTEEELATAQGDVAGVDRSNKVLFYLHALVDKSCIVAHAASGESPKSPFASHELYKMTGYFALVGLLRVQCLLGDYRLALRRRGHRLAAWASPSRASSRG